MMLTLFRPDGFPPSRENWITSKPFKLCPPNLANFTKKFLGTFLSHRDVYVDNNNNNNNNILSLGTGAHFKLLKLKHAYICKWPITYLFTLNLLLKNNYN